MILLTAIQQSGAEPSRDLTMCHPVSRLNTCDACTELVSLEPLPQFILCLTGAEYQDGFPTTI